MVWRKINRPAVKIVGLLICLLVASPMAFAADDGGDVLDRESYNKHVKELDYGEPEPKQDEEADPSEPFKKWDTDLSFDGEMVGPIVLGIVIVTLLFLIIHLVLKHLNERDVKLEQKTGQTYTVEDFDPEIPETDLERFLRIALEHQDYRAAVRVYYLMAIRKLAEYELISWERDKTNLTYVLELEDKMPGSSFRKLTEVYEVIWYGEAPVNSHEFSGLRKAFQQFLKLISPGDE